MDQKFKLPLTLLVLALIALLLNSAISQFAFGKLHEAYERHLQARESIELIDAVLLSAVDMQTGTRGYAITDNPVFLEPYYNARSRLEGQLEKLGRTLQADSRERKTFEALESRVHHARDFFDEMVATQQHRGAEEAQALVMGGEGRRRVDAVRDSAHTLRIQQLEASSKASQRTAEIVEQSNHALLVVTLVDILFFMLAFIVMFRIVRDAQDTHRQLNSLHRESLRNGELLAERNRQQSLQSGLVDVLQSTMNPEEAYDAIRKFGAQLFPRNAGVLYIRSNSRDYFEVMAKWGDGPERSGFEPQQCWGARNNHLYRCDSTAESVVCGHVASVMPEVGAYLCIPIASSDELIGILTLAGETAPNGRQQPVSAEMELFAQEVGKQIGISIANLRLRNSLRSSSIIDALTGLYNRRYLDETLGREIARADRLSQTVGLIMIDVDHFKSFNDNHGHEAGDKVLVEVGAMLKKMSRSSDLACRYGGEELMIVLPLADLDITLQRAEALRQAIKHIAISYGGQTLPPITASFGVAVFPQHGTDMESLIRAADAALYRAKHQGRDRVEVFGQGGRDENR